MSLLLFVAGAVVVSFLSLFLILVCSQFVAPAQSISEYLLACLSFLK